MTEKKSRWTVGEKVSLHHHKTILYRLPRRIFAHFVASRYLCIREASSKNRGILLKVLGTFEAGEISSRRFEAFCKDAKDDGYDFRPDSYYSFRFPTKKQVKEVLQILKAQPELVERLYEIGMGFSWQQGYWVRGMAFNCLLGSKPKWYDPTADAVFVSHRSEEEHLRMSIVYFDAEK